MIRSKSESNEAMKNDVFIVGGGPAGLAAAIAARSRGLSVAVADIGTPPLDKACGEGLMPDAVASLANLGVIIGPEDGYPFDGIRFIDGSRKVEAAFPSGTGVGIRRPALHRMLVDRAREAGVVFFWGARVERTHAGEIVMNGSKVRARWIIGADGHRSRVRRWAGLHQRRQQQVRFGFRLHYSVKPWTDRVEVYWGTNCQFVVTSVSPSNVCVVLMTRNPRLRIGDALPLFPELQSRLVGATVSTTERGALSAMMSVDSVSRNQFALIGDASGSVDAITGEGLRLAFQQALWLGDALANNDLARYEVEHRRIVRLPMFMSRLMLLMDRSVLIRHSVMRVFSAQPKVFAQLLAIHTGAMMPATQPPGDSGSPDHVHMAGIEYQ
jgi:menaquinone-9 beta-reductase